VAEYILHKGGSYLFGNSTCRKKWDELMQARRDMVAQSVGGERRRSRK
jgi:hypothetical protein